MKCCPMSDADALPDLPSEWRWFRYARYWAADFSGVRVYQIRGEIVIQDIIAPSCERRAPADVVLAVLKANGVEL